MNNTVNYPEEKNPETMIYIFKTSVKTKRQVVRLRPVLDKLLQSVRWSFDLDDCDKVLRVDGSHNISATVIKALNEKGYDCEELE